MGVVEALDLNQRRIEDMMHQEGAICASYVLAFPDGSVKVRFAGGADLSVINDMLAYAIYTAHDEGYRGAEQIDG